MTLAETIAALRAKKQLSQGELAELAGVSRQAVSKWETGTSTPELEKLMVLADIFGVTLDELTGRETPQTEVPPIPAAPAVPDGWGSVRIIGGILLAAGLLTGLCGLLWYLPLIGLGGYLAVCGLICLLRRKYAGLTIAWVTFFPLTLLLPALPYWMAQSMSRLVGAASAAGLAVTIWRTVRLIKARKVS